MELYPFFTEERVQYSYNVDSFQNDLQIKHSLLQNTSLLFCGY